MQRGDGPSHNVHVEDGFIIGDPAAEPGAYFLTPVDTASGGHVPPVREGCISRGSDHFPAGFRAGLHRHDGSCH